MDKTTLASPRIVAIMTLFPAEMKSARLRYERLHLDEFDPFELYTYAHEGAPGIEEITEYVTWSPYTHPKAAFDWVERCGTKFERGEGATYVVRPKEGEHADELAGLAGIHPDWDRELATGDVAPQAALGARLLGRAGRSISRTRIRPTRPPGCGRHSRPGEHELPARHREIRRTIRRAQGRPAPQRHRYRRGAARLCPL